MNTLTRQILFEQASDKICEVMAHLGLSGDIVRGMVSDSDDSEIIIVWKYGIENKRFIRAQRDVPRMTKEGFSDYLSLTIGQAVRWTTRDDLLFILMRIE